MEKEKLDKLIVELGDKMNGFLLAKMEVIRADLRFKKAQKDLSYVEDMIRDFKRGDAQLEPIKSI